MSAATVQAMQDLVRVNPVLQPLLTEHLQDQDGEMLPHLLLADFERWCEDNIDTDSESVREVLSSLEDTYGNGNADVQELIAVSFLEHLPFDNETAGGLRDLLGTELTAALQEIVRGA